MYVLDIPGKSQYSYSRLVDSQRTIDASKILMPGQRIENGCGVRSEKIDMPAEVLALVFWICSFCSCLFQCLSTPHHWPPASQYLETASEPHSFDYLPRPQNRDALDARQLASSMMVA